MRLTKKLLIALSLVLSSFLSTALAQDTAFIVSHLDRSNGLSNDKFNAFISTDSRGFHWIGSSSGAYRFDGQMFKHYALTDALEAQSLVHSNFFEDRHKDIWFTTTDALKRYDHKRDIVQSVDFSGIKEDIGRDQHLFHYDSTGHEFLISGGGHIWQYSPDKEIPLVELSPTRSVRYLMCPSPQENQLLLGFPWKQGDGLEIFTRSESTLFERAESKDPFIRSVSISDGLVDQNGEVWLISDEGLIQYDLLGDKSLERYTIPGARSEKLWNICLYNNVLLISTNTKGIWVFDPVKKVFLSRLRDYVECEGTRIRERPRTIHVSNNGVLLVMQEARGIDLIVPLRNKIFNEIKDANGSKIYVKAIYEKRGLGVFVVHRDGRVGLYRSNGELIAEEKVFKTNQVEGRVIIDESPNGEMYLSHSKSLHRLEYEKNSIRLSTIDTVENPIIGLYFGGEFDYILTNKELYKVVDKRIIKVKSKLLDEPLITPFISVSKTEMISYDDKKWLRIIQQSSKGLIVKDSIEVFRPILSAAKEGNKIHLGTTNGIITIRKEPPSSTWLRSEPFLPEANIYDFAKDSLGQIYAMTDKGVAVENSSDGWRTLGLDNGLPDIQLISKASIISNDSKLWVGTEGGLAQASLETPHYNPYKKRVYLKNLWINERLYTETALLSGEKIPLNYNENTLEFSTGIIGEYGTKRATLQYRLLDYQSTWTSSKSFNTIRFTKLPPGSYTLEIRVANEDKDANETFSITLDLAPPFWMTWWFNTLLVIIPFSVLGIALNRAYQKRLEKEREKLEKERLLNAERNRIAKELHDDLGGDLSTILFLSESDDPDDSERNRKRIAELSSSSLENMREIIWVLDTEDSSLKRLLAFTEKKVRQMCEDRRIKVDVKTRISEKSKVTNISSTVRRSVFLLVKETINNSIRHSKCSEINVSFTERQTNRIQIAIQDNGIGFDTTIKSRGNGLANMKARADELGGEYNLTSQPKAGTKVQISLPFSQAT